MACDLNLSEDQRQILDAAAAMLNASYPVSRLREGKHDDLGEIAEFGAFALALGDESGGLEFSIVEEALLHVMFGRHLVSTRALATPIAVRLAAELGHGERAGSVASGASCVCAAVPSGDFLLLIDMAGAEFAVVFGDGRLSLLDLTEASGEPAVGLGHSVPMTRLPLDASAIIGESTDPRLRRAADLLVSAELLGIAEASRDLAVSYAEVREQFGRPIGAFQAIKHHCADMAVAAEVLSSLLDMAAIAERDGREDATFQTAALMQLAPRTALANARTCIQVHGGIGFSAEADAHHYLKQAHVLRQLVGGAALLDLTAPLAPYKTLNERN